MKKLLIILLILCVGCSKNQYQDIYRDDILRAQYQGGYKKGYSEGYYDCLITYLEIKERKEYDTETTTNKVIRQMKERTEKTRKEFDKNELK